jgi:murein hydrolase activator
MHDLRKSLLAALCLGPLCLSALTGAQTTDESATRELEAVEGGLRLSTEKQQALSAKLAETAAALEDISGKLVSLTATIQSKEHLLSRIDNEIAALGAEQTIIKGELNQKKALLSEVLAGLQRLEQNPPPALVVAPDDILAALRGAMMFGAVVPAMKDEANHLIGKLERLAAITIEQHNQKQRLQDEFAALHSARTELDALLVEKTALSLSTGSELQAEADRVEKLAAKSKSLKQLLSSLAESRILQEQRKSAELKAREAELERQRQARRLALSRPQVAFSKSRGRLDYPVQGSILRQFGDETANGTILNGLAVATRTNAQVKSPADGKVEFAGPFRSYGQLLILDAGEGYLVLMAGMASVTAVNGQTLRAGEPVGLMGTRPASTMLLGGAAEDSRPVLYVEFRKQGKPVDPAPWWIGSRKEAQR